MKVSVIGGSGYIGLVTGIGLATHGNDVICVDIDQKKINDLNLDILPIYEDGLSALLAKAKRKNRITFTTSFKSAVNQSDIVFIAVGTPSGRSGETDMSHVYKALSSVASAMNKPKTIVIKSTVPVGSNQVAYQIVRENLTQPHLDFDIVSNPEFLREGRAVKDFMEPERIVIGSKSSSAIKRLKRLYKTFNAPYVITDPTSAEMIKYACNAYLATRLSFINEISEICEQVDANVLNVIEGMKHDSRIGGHYLNPGPGFGGPCLNKDIQSLIHFGSCADANVNLLRAVLSRNNVQIENILKFINELLKKNKVSSVQKVAVLGLSFKAGTNDTRNSPALLLLDLLKNLDVQIAVYDPVVQSLPPDIHSNIHSNLKFAKTPYDAVENASACIVMTEWVEFKELDLQSIFNLMRYPAIVDTRNILSSERAIALGFEYKGVGINGLKPIEEQEILKHIV